MNDNKLYYGDNLDILRQYLADESVDLIYLDPPFNSNHDYNVLFKDDAGTESDAQIVAFKDTWSWGENADSTYRELVLKGPDNVAKTIEALKLLLGAGKTLAYLVMMAARLVELHRVLKPTGSLYLHCDTTSSHYLKLILDSVFGADNFRSEIIWKRTYGRGHTNKKAKRWGVQTDVILYYAKTDDAPLKTLYKGNKQQYIEKQFRHTDAEGRRYQIDNLASPSERPNLMYEYKGYKPPKKGWAISLETMQQWDEEGRLHFPSSKEGRIRRKRYLDELEGETIQNLWDDIPPIGSQAKERLGYPTQKPIKLLERIIEASSHPGDIVLDPFCGCGTAVAAAQKLSRQWMGIDITHLSVALMKYRLGDMFALKPQIDYEVIGEPNTIAGARQLMLDDRFQFQFWALSLVRAIPLGGELGKRKGKKSVDRGVDGLIRFFDNGDSAKTVVVQVKTPKGTSPQIRELRGTIEREKAAIGVFITLEAPSKEMEKEALEAGYYESPVWGKKYRKLQIFTIEQLLEGAQIDMPPQHGTFKQAERVIIHDHTQEELL